MKITPFVRNAAYISSAILVTAFLAFILANPDIISRTPGSFEYVRKGEALMDKGRYPDAVKMYEKAYESSPDNEAIRDNLVYAYSMLAVASTEKDSYDVGIKYLYKAFDVLQSTYTRQNLALMLAKKALSLVKMSQWERARESLDQALDVVTGSVTSQRSLGISLFNYAVSEFKAMREDAAIFLLKKAVLVYADSRVFEFLSDIYYKKTDLNNALLYMEKALKADPENPKLSEKLEKIGKEIKLAGAEKTDALPYFDLKYEKDLPVNGSVMESILERAYSDVGNDLNYMPKARTVVFLYSEKNFREIFKVRDIVRAFYDGNIRIPLPQTVSDEKELISYLYHEYTHAIISARTNNNCPVWLSEGIAVYEELKRTRPAAAINIPASAAEGSGISIQALDDVFKDSQANADKLVLAYMLAFTAVDYIVESRGAKSLDGILSRISAGSHAVNAIDDELLMSEKEFNDKWSGYVVKKYVNK